VANDDGRVAEGLDGVGEAFAEGADRLALVDGDDAEDAGLAGRGAVAGVARALEHQARQLDHHRRIVLDSGEEGVGGQGDDFGIAQGHHGRAVRYAADHRHLAGRLSGADDAEKAGHLAFDPVDGAQPAGAQEVDEIGRIVGVEQVLAARQMDQFGVGQGLVAREQARQGGISDVVRQMGHGGNLGCRVSLGEGVRQG